jgi:5-methylcytosine-specific restriction endonuclease McrA
MGAGKDRFTIRASASRIDKGLLAIPQRFRDLFPQERTRIRIVFDDGEKIKEHTFQPFDSVVKESRILGLRHWLAARRVREGDLISIAVENAEHRLYRVALDRFVLERAEERARRRLLAAENDSTAEEQLAVLSHLTRRRPREVARAELLRIERQSARKTRPTVAPRVSERREVVPSSVRILLRELHDGKCQLCSFTFEKRNGEPYFEVHHLDPRSGHHPSNLLVVCPNCHAQLEHATVTAPTWSGCWLTSLTINGRRAHVRQSLADVSHWGSLVVLAVIAAAARASRFLVR